MQAAYSAELSVCKTDRVVRKLGQNLPQEISTANFWILNRVKIHSHFHAQRPEHPLIDFLQDILCNLHPCKPKKKQMTDQYAVIP